MRSGLWSLVSGPGQSLAWVVASCVVGSAGAGAWGQAAPTGAVDPAMVPARDRLAAEAGLMAELASKAIARVAVLDLRSGPGQPQPLDYQIASDLLMSARTLSPGDVELVRRHAEAAFNAGDEAALLEATRRILELDPKDTVAQLRLLSANIAREQTIEARLAAYERCAGDEGRGLDDAVRSRLALDGALLHRERGDDRSFLRLLSRATQLDPTNKEAALLAYSVYAQRSDDPAGQFEMLSNLLMSDPLDFTVHEQVRDLAASWGAFDAASRFHANAMSLKESAGAVSGASDMVVSLAIRWGQRGPDAVVQEIDSKLAAERDRVRRLRDGGAGLVEGISAAVDEVRLHPLFEQTLIAAAVGAGDRDRVDDAVLMYNRSIEQQATILADPNRRGAEITDEEAAEQLRTLAVSLQLWKLLANHDWDRMADVLSASLATQDDRSESKRAINAWTLVRRGKPAEAMELLDGPGRDDAWTIFARGAALVGLGRLDEARGVLWDLSLAEPVSPLGQLARSMARGLKGDIAQEREKKAAEIERLARTIPAWVDEMSRRSAGFIGLSVDIEAPRMNPLVPATTVVRVRNVAPIPLALGSGRTISSRLLFAPLLTADVDPSLPLPDAEVIELDKRLRLMRGEELVARVDPEIGLVGALREIGIQRPTRLRWRVIQSFRTAPDGRIIAGVGGNEVVTPLAIREGSELARRGFDAVAEALGTSSQTRLTEAIYAARAVLMAPGDLTAAAGKAAVAEALARAYPTWEVLPRALALAVIPPTVHVQELAAFDAVVREERNAALLPLAIVTRATRPDDPLITAAAASGSEVAARVAETQRIRLEGDLPTFATVGYGQLPSGAPTQAPAFSPTPTGPTGSVP